jgi:Flp pilus assembly protein CpaB
MRASSDLGVVTVSLVLSAVAVLAIGQDAKRAEPKQEGITSGTRIEITRAWHYHPALDAGPAHAALGPLG